VCLFPGHARARQALPCFPTRRSSDLVFKPISARSGVWAEPSMVDRAVAEFEDTEQMIATTEALYGPYRWERYDMLVLPPSFPFGDRNSTRLNSSHVKISYAVVRLKKN